MKIKIISSLIIAFLVLPFLFANAQGFVTCSGPDCTIASVVAMISGIINWIIKYLAGPIAALALAYAGVRYITAIGDPGKIRDAHNIFKNVVWGIVIILSAWLVVDFILDRLSTTAFSILK